jgi:hypothetical protein
MMINKENNDKEQKPEPKDEVYVDTARMDVQCHLVIKDKETGNILVNKRG